MATVREGTKNSQIRENYTPVTSFQKISEGTAGSPTVMAIYKVKTGYNWGYTFYTWA